MSKVRLHGGPAHGQYAAMAQVQKDAAKCELPVAIKWWVRKGTARPRMVLLFYTMVSGDDYEFDHWTEAPEGPIH